MNNINLLYRKESEYEDKESIMDCLQLAGTEQNFSYAIMKTPLIHNNFLILIFTEELSYSSLHLGCPMLTDKWLKL